MSYSYQRAIEFFRLLAKESTYKPVHFYAKALNVSSKSIFYYLEQLEHLLDQKTFALHKEPSKGIFLEQSNQEIFLDQIIKENIPLHRQIKILHMLIRDKESPSVTQLSQQFNVAKTSILADYKKILGDLTTFTNLHIQLVRQKIYISNNFLGKAQLHLLFIQKINRILPQPPTTAQQLFNQLHAFYPQGCRDQALKALDQLLQSLPRHQQSPHAKLCLAVIFLIFLYESPTSVILPPIMQLYLPHPLECLLNRILPPHLHSDNNKRFLYTQLVTLNLTSAPTISPPQSRHLYQILMLLAHTLDNATIASKETQNALTRAYTLFQLQAKLAIDVDPHTSNILLQHHSLMLNIALLTLTYYHHHHDLPYTTLSACTFLAYLILTLEKPTSHKVYLLSNLDKPSHLLLKKELTAILPASAHLEDLPAIDLLSSTQKESCFLISTYPLPIHDSYHLITPKLTHQAQENLLQKYLCYCHHPPQNMPTTLPLPQFTLIPQLIHKNLFFSESRLHTKPKIFALVARALLQYHFTTINLQEEITLTDNFQKVDTNHDWVVLQLPPHYVRRSSLTIYLGEKAIQWHHHVVRNLLLICLCPEDQRQTPQVLREIYDLLRQPHPIKIIKELFTSHA
ncbi:hypothetical protein [Entomospira culicis]|uniref:HTH domain-containing protein n=1 Tax=Entomospira culicis TaxID=2719989 RepID=A0A968GF80_9SPIO|nr:hypothetical protein [Entomospira culicis]NIZ19230.1 hypothetical protein [Entomospira culicis]NIZ69444.1 hypothetical protein [Entomospira culicis]WDI36560.1 hypothetical protein PVA46_04355 [Entomospira culicis]WDI38186.1 hypothetical protein PVA47_04355 [Entomospira culicis]